MAFENSNGLPSLRIDDLDFLVDNDCCPLAITAETRIARLSDRRKLSIFVALLQVTTWGVRKGFAIRGDKVLLDGVSPVTVELFNCIVVWLHDVM